VLFSGKIPSYVAARLTGRYLVPYLPLFSTIRDYSRLFVTIRTIRDYSYYSLFAIRNYSRLFAIRCSGFTDTIPVQITTKISEVSGKTLGDWKADRGISRMVEGDPQFTSQARAILLASGKFTLAYIFQIALEIMRLPIQKCCWGL